MGAVRSVAHAHAACTAVFFAVCTACYLRGPPCVHVSKFGRFNGLSPCRLMAACVSTFSNKEWNSAGAMIAERCPLVTRPASSRRVWLSFGCVGANVFLESLDHGQIILLCYIGKRRPHTHPNSLAGLMLPAWVRQAL